MNKALEHQIALEQGEIRHVGVMDLGSNTARLVVYAFEPHTTYKLTDQVRQRVRLAEGLGENQRLQPAPIERAVETLNLFRSLCQASRVPHIIAVATSAVRDAQNQGEFLRQVKRRTRLDLRVLSGTEEAYYGFLGVTNTLDVRNGLMFDLGGGSIQITRVAGRKVTHSVSLPLGVVRMTEQFMPANPPTRKQVAALRDDVSGQFGQLDWLPADRDADAGALVGMGGTARALAKLDQESRRYPLERIHGYVLTLERLDALIDRMSGLDTRGLLAMPGMNADRVDVILPGALVVRELMRLSGYNCITVSGAGLREGVFFTEFLKGARSPVIPDVRSFSIENTSRQYGAWNDHARHVRKLALELFDQLRELHGYGAWEREILGAAALLHDIGYAISFFDHDEHSQYLILNSDLSAYTHRELAMLGLMARYHRKGEVACGAMCDLLEKDDERRVSVMAAMLRLSEYLERGRRQAVRQLTCNIGAAEIVIAARTRGDASIELWEAGRNTGLLESVFNRSIRLVKE
ncbi:MAG: Ppx/GppA family phosphatase [Chloroflexi bacterium]|nr:Ppx/GppA family phosphatase [Chloroflexota bacterium]MCL5274838.1 Ppx/GppA family phosphatase [Chloroflexota bacterium]